MGKREAVDWFWRTCDFHHIVSLAVSGGVVVTSAGGGGHPWLGANTWLFSPGRRIQGAGGLSAGGGGLGRHCVPFSRLFVAAGWATGQGRVGLFWDGCSHVRIRGSFPRFPEGHGFFPNRCTFVLPVLSLSFLFFFYQGAFQNEKVTKKNKHKCAWYFIDSHLATNGDAAQILKWRRLGEQNRRRYVLSKVSFWPNSVE